MKTAVQNGEEWTVTEANQSMTDGEVTLTVRERNLHNSKNRSRPTATASSPLPTIRNSLLCLE